MESARCDLVGFGEVVARMVAAHVEGQRATAEDLVRKAGRTTVRELRDGPLTPAESGEYAASWGMTTERDRDGWCEVTVHNRKHWQLTHLLEKGHQLFVHGRNTDRRVPAYPHLEPAYVEGSEVLRNASVDN